MALAIFFAFCIRSSKSDEEIAGHVDDDDQVELAEDEEYLHEIEVRLNIPKNCRVNSIFLETIFVCQWNKKSNQSFG